MREPSVNSDIKLQGIGEEKKDMKGSRRRNAYKSIIRHMQSHVRKNPLSIMRMLQEEGFSKEDIEHAFFVITSRQAKSKHKFKFLALLKEMVRTRSIYTYILKDTLSVMIIRWEEEGRGRILKKNYETYREVCEDYYEEAVRAISNSLTH